jgi:DNA polymerase-3 subunit alpha
MFDFAARVDAKRLNKSVLEALVCSGACDAMHEPIGVSRASASASIELALERARAASKDRDSGQSNLFGLFAAAASGKNGKNGGAGAATSGSGDRYSEAAPWDLRELLVAEKKALGFYLSGHPLDRYGKLPVATTDTVGDQGERAKVRLAGMVEGYRERLLKGGTGAGGKMAFFELEDRMGRIEVKCRNAQVEAYASILSSGEPVMIRGMVVYDRRNEDEEEAAEPTPQILLDDAVLLADAIRAETRGIAIRLSTERARKEHMGKLAEHLRSCKGGCPVLLTLVLEEGAEVQLALGGEFRVEPSDKMLGGLEKIFGEKVAELRTAAV